jgi:hypothetical protein
MITFTSVITTILPLLYKNAINKWVCSKCFFGINKCFINLEVMACLKNGWFLLYKVILKDSSLE